MEKIININITSEYVGKRIYIYKLKGVDYVKRDNTERFAKIIANNYVILDYSSERVINALNPHLVEQLAAERCNNWRVDGLWNCGENYKTYRPERAGIWLLNTSTGEFCKKLERGEVACKNCGNVIYKHQKVGAYCVSCLQDLGYTTRYGYHDYNGGYPIREKIDETKTPVFGCEIERDYLSGNDFGENLKSALLEVFKTMHAKEIKANKTISREFVFMRDSSLSEGGCEWITFPHSYKWYKANAGKLQECIEIFKKYNFGNSSSVGNHIHINNKYFKSNNKLSACKLALCFSIYWDELKAIAKRGSTGYTTKPAHAAEDDIFTLAEKTLNTWRDHNVAVNTQHSNTTEIRLWGGVDSVQDLLLFLDLTQALTIYINKKSIETIQKSKFIDILNCLTDKPEHLQEIKSRLISKGITRHTQSIEQLIAEGV